MALEYISHLTTFAAVEDWYNRITPLRGANNKDKDIRPFGDRNRKWDRIAKIDDNCYAISDGWNLGDPIFGYTYDHSSKPLPEDFERFAPIVWRRHEDGTETIKVRNGHGPSAHMGRYAFLNRCLPRGMYFHLDRNGRQYISVSNNATRQFLAKGTTVSKGTVAYIDAKKAANPGNTYGPQHYFTWATTAPDNADLIFQRTDSGWTLISHNGLAEEPHLPRRVVDKTLKAGLKEQINEFREWTHLMAPMIDVTSQKSFQEYAEALTEWQKAQGGKFARSWGSLHSRVTPEVAREIVGNPDHPMRVVMAAFAISACDLKRECPDTSERAAIKRDFNKWLNKVLAFNKTV